MVDQANLEVRHHDANHALFMSRAECAKIVVEIGASEGRPERAIIVATNIQNCGKSKMANREIADLAFRLATELRPWNDDLRTAPLKRILEHLVRADRWEAQLQPSRAS